MAPASAIRIRLDAIEKPRSRRRGTSNACSTCTHRKSDPSGTRAWSTFDAYWTACRNCANAAIIPIASRTFVVTFDRARTRYEKR